MAKANKAPEAEGKETSAAETAASIVEIVETAETPSAKIDGIDELKKQLEAEKEARKADQQARQQAQRERDEAAQQAFRAKNDQADAEGRLFDGAVAQLKSNTQNLKQQLKEAWATGDFDTAANIQEAIADNSAKINSIEAGKQALKERPKEQPRPLDPVEAFIKRTGINGASADWLRAHPECATDERLTRKMIRAAQDAQDDGIEVNTRAYFDFVEERLGFSGRRPPPMETPDDEPALSSASAPTQRRQSPAAAPVSRNISPSGERTGRIRLTRDEAEIARMTGLTEQEYYANKMRDLN